MAAAESWAVGREHIAKMQLVTGNPRAADFYTSLGYIPTSPFLARLGLPGWLEKELVVLEKD